MIPGELWTPEGEIKINVGRALVSLRVANSGDRPIQVGSHYHFYETNSALHFDREKARGFRLNIPAGTAVRFEPGQSRDVELVALGGLRKVYGFAGKIMGALDKPAGGKGKPATGKVKPGTKRVAVTAATVKTATRVPASKKTAVNKSGSKA